MVGVFFFVVMVVVVVEGLSRWCRRVVGRAIRKTDEMSSRRVGSARFRTVVVDEERRAVDSWEKKPGRSSELAFGGGEDR